MHYQENMRAPDGARARAGCDRTATLAKSGDFPPFPPGTGHSAPSRRATAAPHCEVTGVAGVRPKSTLIARAVEHPHIKIRTGQRPDPRRTTDGGSAEHRSRNGGFVHFLLRQPILAWLTLSRVAHHRSSATTDPQLGSSALRRMVDKWLSLPNGPQQGVMGYPVPS